MAASDLPHVFEPFFTTRRAGTGLGLAIARKVVEAWEERSGWRAGRARALASRSTLFRARPAPVPMFPAEHQMKKACVVTWCYTGDLGKAEEAFAPIRQSSPPLMDFAGPIPFPVLQSLFDGLHPEGLQWYWKADFFQELSDKAVDLHVKYGERLPSPHSTMHLYPIGGAAGRVAKEETAFSFREAKFAEVVVGVDPDPANNPRLMQWARDYWLALHPFSAGGGYVNIDIRDLPATGRSALRSGMLATALLPAFLVSAAPLDAALAERFARLAVACVHQEYPNKIAHVMGSDADARPPRELTPAFYGCYDWHSSVHGHWLLARVARLLPGTPLAAEASAGLARSLTTENVAAEARYLEGKGRVSFERPYGLAWLLQLDAELREWGSPEARGWATALAPLEKAAVERIAGWLRKLTRPIRIGEHSQTAFSLGLVLDWAQAAQDAPTEALIVSRSRDFYGKDRDCPIEYEPSGEDFLSPCLAEADLMRRVLPPAAFARWLAGFLPGLPEDGSSRWLEPGIVTDPTDPKLAHLDGLNLSRAWMLEGMAAGLPEGDRRIAGLRAAARVHREKGLAAVTGEHYEGGHWLGTFAVYLVTGRGLR